MAKLLPFGGVTFPSQGSNEITERVKLFVSIVDLADLETQINDFFDLLAGDTVINRPSIRAVSFNVLEKQLAPDEGTFQYFAQVHYILIGDADDSLNT